MSNKEELKKHFTRVEEPALKEDRSTLPKVLEKLQKVEDPSDSQREEIIKEVKEGK